ncbi:MAG TPA: 1,4-alpha-glucan branching protein GlgB [Actinomycetota bacterium]|nr:1,4-alpha-glucan branching protein GlgB [Actinomycetota bacterium]
MFLAGSHPHIQEKLGAHRMTVEGVQGTYFAVWAPGAETVSVIGDFNRWEPAANVLAPHDRSGIWEGFIPDVGKGSRYKFHVTSPHHGYRADKADPFAFFSEVSPGTASVVWDLAYRWGDQEWMETRGRHNALNAPISIYELHLGSWKRRPADNASRPLTYRELAPRLTEYVNSMGFTHVEFMPVMEHPFYGSWGYHVTGYFAPTSRYGTPQDLMYLIDHLHQAGIGVILDWVPSHFPRDEHGLGYFDGTHLYEHQDPRQAIHPEWNSFIFNYGRPEVCSFLISNAEHWLSAYHADGIRVDAVASMLYLDYARQPGEWIPNRMGGRENLEAIDFLKRLNEQVRFNHPEVQMIAEESTAWPMVSRPVHVGGLGFGLKWDMGWMHDTLHYMSKDPIHRSHHHNELTFRMLYAFNENFILPLSHDEVVHGKSSLVGRMPGDEWQRYANLRLLFGYMYAQAGKKMLFMGGEFGQVSEWKHDGELEWDALAYPTHAGTQLWVMGLNRLYREEAALHQLDCDPEGFEWVDADDSERSIISFIRRGSSFGDLFLFVGNFTPVPRFEHLIGVPRGGPWRVVLNSDGRQYGGTGFGAVGDIQAMPDTANGRVHSIKLTLPPLACLFLKSSAAS